MVLGPDVLDCLPMISVDIDSDHRIIEFRVSALQDFIILVFPVIQSIQSLEDEIEERAQVLGRWRGHKNIAESVHNRSSNRDTQRSGLAPASACIKAQRGLQIFLGDRINH